MQIPNTPSVMDIKNGIIESRAIGEERCSFVVSIFRFSLFALASGFKSSRTGIGSRVVSGDGESTVHSSVLPSHGPGPTFLFAQCVFTKFQNMHSILSPIRKAPTVLMQLVVGKPSRAPYVNVLRGIPFNPVMCIGKNVTWKPIKKSQKCHFPKVSFNFNPVIFG